MPEQWHYSEGNEKLGPVSRDELRAMAADGRLAPTDLVWRDGMSKWTEGKRVNGLFPSKVGPPPVPRRRQTGRTRSAPKKGFWGSMFDHKIEEAWTGGQMTVLVIGSLLVGIFGIIVGVWNLRNLARRTQGAVLLAIGALGMLLAVGGASTQTGGRPSGPSAGYYPSAPSLPAGVDNPDLWAQVLRAYPHASRQERLAMYQMLVNAKVQRQRERAIREMYTP
jgi:hypothetical protein